jgi:hypothetical protein
MRATESGKPDDWDTPYVHPTGPSNKELMATKDAKTAARNESLNTPMAPVTVQKSRSDDTRMRNYGDD